MVPLHSPRGLVSCSFISFFRVMAHVFDRFRFIYFWLTLYPVFSWASWCAMGCKELSFKLPDCACMLYLCDATFNFAYKLNGVLHWTEIILFYFEKKWMIILFY